jgi:Ran GTPase-activating protein (RanGAP) involved in mRNA processing and transport
LRKNNKSTAVFPELHRFNDLRVLDLKSCFLGDNGVKSLATELHHCPLLQTLDLSYNEIGIEGMRILTPNLPQGLRTLKLLSNNIDDDCIQTLSQVLPGLSSLHTLHLQFNTIGDNGIASLVQALVHCYVLRVLNLAYNIIGDIGAQLIANSIQSHQLDVLYLKGNPIREQGNQAIALALRKARLKIS